MTLRLMTVLCFTLQSGDVTERAELRTAAHRILLSRNGKLLSSTEAPIDVVMFDSPTEAVLGATEILQTIHTHKNAEIRIVVHTAELDLQKSVLEGSAMNIAVEMLDRTRWGDLCISESSYLSMQKSEVVHKVEETSWQLKIQNRKVLMYRVKAPGGSTEKFTNQASAREVELSALRRALKPAPYDRRVLSMLIDYLITLAVMITCLSAKTLPEYLDIVSGRYLYEFEDFDYDHGLSDSYRRASNGEMVEVGSKATFNKTITVKKGHYDAYIGYGKGSLREGRFKVKIGDFETRVNLNVEGDVGGTRPIIRLRIAENLLLDGVVSITVKQEAFVDTYVLLDSFLLLPSGVGYADQLKKSFTRTNRYEEFERVLFLWDTDYRNFLIFNVLCVPLGLWILQAIFLSFTTWTPGYLAFQLRVVTLRGEKPGLKRAFKRFIAQFASVFSLGFGWIWPLISHDDRTWSDMFSETKVVKLE
jgi:uncharacterized RDD family membrane protein YckC